MPVFSAMSVPDIKITPGSALLFCGPGTVCFQDASGLVRLFLQTEFSAPDILFPLRLPDFLDSKLDTGIAGYRAFYAFENYIIFNFNGIFCPDQHISFGRGTSIVSGRLLDLFNRIRKETEKRRISICESTVGKFGISPGNAAEK